MISRSKFKVRIKVGEEERWADADMVFAHLIKNYTKAELNGKKPEPYTDKVNSFFKQVDKEWKKALKEAYPNVNIEDEIKVAKMWLLSNPNKAKSNFKTYLNNWMAKAMRTGKTLAVDGRAQYEKYVTPEIPEEELCSPEEINKLMQGIKNNLRSK
tara:strand:+ start:888 stop:1355 length:468 start_codon:yes stop_codon:yes gene_type:complete